MSATDYENTVLKHYAKQEVQREITRFSHNRWVAIHCELPNSQGYQVLLRYKKAAGKGKTPLTISRPDDVSHLLNQFQRLRPRTFYASVCTYRKLLETEDLKDPSNISLCTPTWDIDNTSEKWNATIEAAKTILSFLQEEGVHNSVFLKWSGKGIHVHVHQGAFSESFLRRVKPLDVAYAIVEYANRTLQDRFIEIAEDCDAPKLSVENEIDLQRVFTSPLSLHRTLSNVIVCIPPAKVDSFTPDWAKVEGYSHWRDWDKSETGEADSLAEKAYGLIGGYKAKPQIKPKPNQATGTLAKWIRNESKP